MFQLTTKSEGTFLQFQWEPNYRLDLKKPKGTDKVVTMTGSRHERVQYYRIQTEKQCSHWNPSQHIWIYQKIRETKKNAQRPGA